MEAARRTSSIRKSMVRHSVAVVFADLLGPLS